MFIFSKFQKQILTKINYDSHTKAHFYLVQNFEFQYFWGFSEKETFFVHEDFLGSSQNWIIFRGYFYAF